jgi:hypothetical protein
LLQQALAHAYAEGGAQRAMSNALHDGPQAGQRPACWSHDHGVHTAHNGVAQHGLNQRAEGSNFVGELNHQLAYIILATVTVCSSFCTCCCGLMHADQPLRALTGCAMY